VAVQEEHGLTQVLAHWELKLLVVRAAQAEAGQILVTVLIVVLVAMADLVLQDKVIQAARALDLMQTLKTRIMVVVVAEQAVAAEAHLTVVKHIEDHLEMTW
jgi:hypothetical protein